MELALTVKDGIRFNAGPLRLARVRAGLRLSDLATMIGCTPTTCANVLTERYSNPSTVAKIAHALNVDPADCWDSEEDAAG